MHKENQMKKILLLTLILLACDDHSDAHDHSDEISIEAEACEHIVEADQALKVNASIDTNNALTVNAEHKRVEITLVNGTGYVSYDSAQEVDYLFFFSQDVDIEFISNDGSVITVTDLSDQTYPCSEMISVFKAKLGVGKYLIKITQTQVSDTPVYLVSEESI